MMGLHKQWSKAVSFSASGDCDVAHEQWPTNTEHTASNSDTRPQSWMALGRKSGANHDYGSKKP
jgi:hypothetical protein